ncbi:hypothetical protein AYI74_09425 [Shewanella algae]|nr:hypothetical protein AYI74_09425 [Shewanella algae]
MILIDSMHFLMMHLIHLNYLRRPQIVEQVQPRYMYIPTGTYAHAPASKISLWEICIYQTSILFSQSRQVFKSNIQLATHVAILNYAVEAAWGAVIKQLEQ